MTVHPEAKVQQEVKVQLEVKVPLEAKVQPARSLKKSLNVVDGPASWSQETTIANEKCLLSNAPLLLWSAIRE